MMKKINIRLRMRLALYIAGTVLLITMGTIVAVNFVRDGKLFEASTVRASIDTSSKTADSTTSAAGNGGDRNKGTANTGQKNGNGAGTDSKSPVRVEIINYTKEEKLAGDLKASLQTAGFEVSVNSAKPDKSVQTTIIERNDRKTGEGVRKMMRTGQVVHWPDSRSAFDVTVKLGEDYLP